uniref:Uncharacterized protein n=1 Tax=Rhodnius prolixus TaxID=13249 RepID=T1HSP4_RHOPR
MGIMVREKYTSLVSLQPNKFPLDEFSLLLCVALTSFVFCFVKRKFGIQKYLETSTFEETVQAALINSNKTMNSLEKILSRLNSLEKTVQLSTATIGDIIKCVKELEEKLIVLEREDGGWKNSYDYEKKLVVQQVPEKDSNYSNCSLQSSLEQEDYTDIKEKEIFEQLKELQESISKLRQQTKTIMSSPSSQKTVICSSSSKTNNSKIESPRPFYLSNVKYRQLSNIKTELVPTLNKVQSRINDIKSRNS